MHPTRNLEHLRHWRFGDQPSLFVLFPLAFACQLTRTCAANIQYGPCAVNVFSPLSCISLTILIPKWDLYFVMSIIRIVEQ
jgi:hypothetical protein